VLILILIQFGQWRMFLCWLVEHWQCWLEEVHLFWQGLRIPYWLGELELGCQEMIQFWLVTVILSLLGQVVLLADLGPVLFGLEPVVLQCC
jgi:hypothetical protein